MNMEPESIFRKKGSLPFGSLVCFGRVGILVWGRESSSALSQPVRVKVELNAQTSFKNKQLNMNALENIAAYRISNKGIVDMSAHEINISSESTPHVSLCHFISYLLTPKIYDSHAPSTSHCLRLRMYL